MTPAETRRAEGERVARGLIGGSTTEALAGGAAAVLAILGLLDLLPTYLAAIATIFVGVALFAEGGAIAMRFENIRRTSANGRDETAVGGGFTVEMMGGAAGVTLGVLALVGISPWQLMPIAAIVMGGALLIGAGASQEVEDMLERRSLASDLLHQAVGATQGTRVLVGLAAVTLGILVLAGVGSTVSLTLVALLALGGAQFLFGSALGARLARRVNR